ncbi:flagellar biosynthesis anti-sigma factor FlgM [Oceanobacillus sp. FSL H7-0719]|uniref:flagellar biosynthesis anti-sigma factor FlgM n=1 Tax=Oceanobacillus sp. FSL H7-0719 TaxID=2954507 RepID=UPI003254C2BC
MKINGPNQVNFNPYKQHLQKQADIKKAASKSDELQISKEALKLQEKEKPAEKRAAHIEQIKQAVDSGEYKVDIEKTAQKMIDFWKK